jgi:hypothetical protein
MRRIPLILAGILLASSAWAEPGAGCAPDRTALVILGTFHMEGSTQDLVKHSPADVTTPRRQAEIAELVARIAGFRPTRVAIESSRTSTFWNERYAAWRIARGTLGPNEIEQVGFRLADAAGLAALSPVDYPMWMDGTTAAERHDPKPAPAGASPAEGADQAALRAAVEKQLAIDDAKLADGTIAGYLAYLNSPERALQNHRWDVMSNLAPGAGTSMYETTDYATNWYKRNLRIWTNLVDVAGPGERIVLLIGAGHSHLLGQLAADDARFCLVPVADLLGGA